MNEKFSVELELITKKIDNQIAKLKNKLNNLNKSTQIKTPETVGTFTGTDGKTHTLVRKTQEEIEQSRKNLEDLNQETEKSKGNFGDVFEKGIGKIKKFTLSLVGLRSVFALVSRASSAYLSQDTELANKLQSVWTGLGAILSPIIEKIANFGIKLVGYINYFIKALTGVDYLAKATQKSMDKTNKSAKATAKTLAGFDELTNLNTDSGSGADVNNSLGDLNNIKLDSNITNVLDKIARSLNKIYTKYLKPIFSWISSNPEWAIGIVAGIEAITLALSSTGGGLVGALAALDAVLVTLAYKTIKDTVNEYKSLNEQIKETNELNKESNTNTRELTNTLIEQSKAGELNNSEEEKLGNLLLNNIKNLKSINESYKETNDSIIFNNKAKRENNQAIKDNDVLIEENIEKLKYLYDAGKLNEEQTSDYISVLKNYEQQLLQEQSKIELSSLSLNEQTTALKDNKNKLKDVQEQLKQLNKTKATVDVKVNTDTTTAKEKITNFFQKLQDTGVFKTLFPKISSFKSLISKLASLDTGTNYVPNDQLAMIHKGEAVIPKKFNSKEYFGGGNDITNQLLERLISVVQEKDTGTYLDGKAIGQSTINYINSQSRIMGRSVIN